MSKRMNDEQIETIITQAHADVIAVMRVTQSEQVINRALSSALRSCFMSGQDNGQNIVLERAESLMGDNVASVQDGQMGRSMAIVLAWVAARKGRCFTGTGASWASVLTSDDDPKEDGYSFHYEHGDSPVEALSKLATWCQEHGKKYDTTPAPAPEPSEPVSAPAEQTDDEVTF